MTEQVLTTDEDNYIIMTVDEIVDRLRAERDEYHETNKRLRAQRDQLLAALRMVLENMGGHQHWDSFGTAGANCPICQQQMEASAQAWEILRAIAAVEGKP